MSAWRASDVFVVSDLHLAAERDCGLFQADAELAAFFEWINRETAQSAVVLAGDILDFLVSETDGEAIPPFDAARAPERTRAIINHHGEVFDALAALARSPNHNLVWLGGNHDPELALPETRQVIERALNGQTTHPPVRWLTHGEGARLEIGVASVLIEHGDLYDSWNRINHSDLLRTISLANRGLRQESLVDEYHFTPPPGSHLVVEHLSSIRREYPWAEWLKPEWRAAVPVLHEILPPERQIKVLKMAQHWRDLVKTSIVTEIRSKAGGARITRGGKTTAASNDELTRYLLTWLDEAEQPTRRRKSRDDSIARLIKRLREVAKHDQFFDLTAEEDGKKMEDMAFLARHGVDLIVHGHTHAAKAHGLYQDRGLYLNTGTWGRLLQLPPHDAEKERWQSFIVALLDGSQQGFLRPTFARITEKPEDRVQAALFRWDAAGPSPLAVWRLDPGVGKWVKEG